MNIHHVPLIASVAFAAFLGSCSHNAVSPNPESETSTVSAESMGHSTFASIDENSEVSELLSFDNPAPEEIFTLPVIPTAVATSPAALAKKSAGVSFTLDTIGGMLRITTTAVTALTEKYDTIDVLLNAEATDAIEGNEAVVSLRGKTVFTNGATDYYIVEDLDGDNIINRGTTSVQASLIITTLRKSDISSGEVTTTTFQVDAGDGDFSTEGDNELMNVSWKKRIAGEIVASADVSDGDGDGRINPAKAGTTIITMFDAEKLLRPLVKQSTCTIHVERTEQGEERVSQFSASRQFITGRTNSIIAISENGDTTLVAGEKVLVYCATTATGTDDSIYTAKCIYTIDPGTSLGNPSDNILYAVSCTREYRFGIRTSSAFTCTFDPAVMHGQTPEAGTFSYVVTFKNNTTATLDGSFTRETLAATHTTTNGDVTDITLTRK